MKEAHNHSRVSPEGVALGKTAVAMAEKGLLALMAEGETDDRCKTCAFRAGTVPNGCAQTQLDVFKCVIENKPFLCHQTSKNQNVCHGWYAARNLMRRMEKAKGPFPIRAVPYEFSPPDEDL